MRPTREQQRKVRQLWQECLVGGEPDPGRLAAAVARLAARRERDAEALLRGLRRTLAAHRRARRVRITGAMPVDPAQVAGILAALGESGRPAAEVEVSVDPALIAGLCVARGHEVVDVSLTRQVERLRTWLAQPQP